MGIATIAEAATIFTRFAEYIALEGVSQTGSHGTTFAVAMLSSKESESALTIENIKDEANR